MLTYAGGSFVFNITSISYRSLWILIQAFPICQEAVKLGHILSITSWEAEGKGRAVHCAEVYCGWFVV